MKQYLPYIVIAALIIALFWQRGCSGDKDDTITVTTPEIKGKSDTIYFPVPMPREKEYVYRYINGTDTIVTVTQNPINQDLLNFYLANQNKRDSLYTDAIGEREYNIPIEDSLLLTNNYIKVQGKVLAFQQNYTIKPRQIEVPRDNFSLLAGVEAGNTIQLDKFVVKGNLGVRLGSGQLNLGYDTENRIWAGYSWVLIK